MHIEERGKSLLIRFSHDGKSYSFSLAKHNSPVGRSNAKLKIAEIEKDIAYGNFDTTLLKYKPRKLGNNPTAITAVALFEQYAVVMIREKDLTPSSVGKYKAIASLLRECLGDKLALSVNDSIAKDVVAVMTKTLTGNTVKNYLFLIRACWDWAKEKLYLTDTNPWSDCIGRVKVQPRKQMKPFAIAELQAIIAEFRASPHYSHYTEFVIFLSQSACRIGEAAGLRWRHLGADFSTVWIGESISRGNQKGTKTGKSRTVQLSPTVISMLLDRHKRLNPQPEDLVFPSPKGLPIDDHNFCTRAWKTILESCQIEYQSPYKLRHSAISHALKKGANFIALAEQTGHDKRVMLSTYAHAIDRECLFVDFT